MKINRLAVLSLAVAALAILLLMVLHGRRPPTPSAEEIKRVFPEVSLPERAPATAGLDVYIDGSGSMQGFLTTKGSIFRQTLSDLLLSATQSGFDMRVYNFSSTIQPVTGPLMSAVQDARSYHGAETPLATLLTEIGKNPDRTSIVVSDLVLSSPSPKEDPRALVKAMAALGARRPQIELMGYRSDYEGDYQSERTHEKYKLKMSQKVPEMGRPFYLIVVAPNAASMEKAKKNLLNHIQAESEKFEATAAAFDVEGATLSANAPPKQWVVVSRYAVRNKGSNRFETAFRLAHAQGGDTVDLPVTVTYASHVAFHRASDLALAGQTATFAREAPKAGRSPDPQRDARHGWGLSAPNAVVVPLVDGQKLESKQTVVDGGAKPNDFSKVQLLLRLPSPQRQEWNIYRLKIRPGESNLELPDWITRWSTDDDSAPASGNKTYLLHLLVGTMESSITQERVCGEWILRVGGEE